MSASAGTRRLARVGGVPSHVRVLHFVDQLDAGRKTLANVEALGALSVIPVIAKPVRGVPKTVWHTLAAPVLPAAHKLLAVDDTVRATGALAQIRTTRLQNHGPIIT